MLSINKLQYHTKRIRSIVNEIKRTTFCFTRFLNSKSRLFPLVFFYSFSLIVGLVGCNKLVEVAPPVTSITDDNVYASDATAIAVLTGIYGQLSTTSNYNSMGLTTISLFSGLSSDELTLFGGGTGNYNAYYTNNLSVGAGGFEYWNNIYPYIFTCNSAIEGLASGSSLTPAIKRQLEGEAKFMRALFYFYLVNLYGDVPLALSTDYSLNGLLSRSSKAQVYSQIVNDLKDAQTSLSADYLDPTLLNTTNERVRPTKWAAAALLARTYLYTQNWDSAEVQSTSVINNLSMYGLDSLNGVFLANSTEAIWQLQPVNTGWNTEDARVFIIPSTGPDPFAYPVYLSPQLLNSFESTDLRRTNWIDSTIVAGNTYYFPYKYKVNLQGAPVMEYLMMLRLGEQYLIRAEARAYQGNTTGAVQDLNIIRIRAGLPPTTAASQSDLIAAIQHERQVELFTELGQRWLDLKRTGSVDSVMNSVCPLKNGSNWVTNQKLYPIPLGDIQRDPNLVQNPGY